MKRIKFFLSIVLFCIASSLYAKKETVYFPSFTTTADVSPEDINQIRARIIEAFSNNGRFIILDGKTPNVNPDKAKYLIDGSVTQLSYIEKTGIVKKLINKATKVYNAKYQCSFVLNLQIIKKSDGSLIDSQIFNGTTDNGFLGIKSYHCESPVTEKIALNNSINSIIKKLNEWIDNNFLAEGDIIEIDEVKENKVITAFVSLGIIDGIKKGQKFNVKLRTSVGGYTRYKIIGEARCEAVEGENLSFVKITKGGEEIYKYYRETPDQLFVQTIK